MHKQVKDFCTRIKRLYPEAFRGDTLDVGSLDINGNNRYLFDGTYTGLDIGQGANVDIVMPVHEYQAITDRQYDCVISTEMLEHDRHWYESIRAMYHLVKPGGLLLITCATTGRPEHGTKATSEADSPFTTDYYRNIDWEDLRKAIDGLPFFDSSVQIYNDPADLHFYGIKAKIG